VIAINIHDFERHMDSVILGRGLSYYRGGYIQSLESVDVLKKC